jgi:CBS domain-containing protein
MAVRDWMTTDVVTFHPDENVRDAMRRLVTEDVDAGPVIDATGAVAGMLSTSDLIVEEALLHIPTAFNFFGVEVEWETFKHHRKLDADVSKKLGASVGEVMTADLVFVSPDDTIETAATKMHDSKVSRLPVIDDGTLVGLLSQNDVLRAMIADQDSVDEDSVDEDSVDEDDVDQDTVG